MKLSIALVAFAMSAGAVFAGAPDAECKTGCCFEVPQDCTTSGAGNLGGDRIQRLDNGAATLFNKFGHKVATYKVTKSKKCRAHSFTENKLECSTGYKSKGNGKFIGHGVWNFSNFSHEAKTTSSSFKYTSDTNEHGEKFSGAGWNEHGAGYHNRGQEQSYSKNGKHSHVEASSNKYSTSSRTSYDNRHGDDAGGEGGEYGAHWAKGGSFNNKSGHKSQYEKGSDQEGSWNRQQYHGEAHSPDAWGHGGSYNYKGQSEKGNVWDKTHAEGRHQDDKYSWGQGTYGSGGAAGSIGGGSSSHDHKEKSSDRGKNYDQTYHEGGGRGDSEYSKSGYTRGGEHHSESSESDADSAHKGSLTGEISPYGAHGYGDLSSKEHKHSKHSKSDERHNKYASDQQYNTPYGHGEQRKWGQSQSQSSSTEEHSESSSENKHQPIDIGN